MLVLPVPESPITITGITGEGTFEVIVVVVLGLYVHFFIQFLLILI